MLPLSNIDTYGKPYQFMTAVHRKTSRKLVDKLQQSAEKS